MKVYLASSFLNKKVARAAMDQIEKSGHRITMDWTAHAPTNELGILGNQSVADMDGVKEADVLIYLWPGRFGSSSELGAALALGKIVIMVGAAPRHESVFFNFPSIIHVAEIENAISELDELQRKLYRAE